MLAMLAPLVFAAAAMFALGAMWVTLQGRSRQIAALIAQHRTMKHERDFRVSFINGTDEAQIPSVAAGLQPRRLPYRAVRLRAERPIVPTPAGHQPRRAAA